MKARLLSSALVLGAITASQTALALPPSSQTPYVLQQAIGQYSLVDLDPQLDDELDAHLLDIITPDPADPSTQITTGAVIMVGRHGKVVYLDGMGLRDGNTALGGDPSISMPEDAIFDLESMTKPFTATVILKMHDLGILDIDDLVIDYLPDFEYVASQGSLVSDPEKVMIPIRDVLRHASGMYVDGPDGTTVYGETDPYLFLSHQDNIDDTGVSVLYSDIAYRLLGNVAERAYAAQYRTDGLAASSPCTPLSGCKTLRELVKLYISDPLGMLDTDYEPTELMTGSTLCNPNAGTCNKLDRVAGTGKFAHHHLPGVPQGYKRGEVQDDQDWWTQRNNSFFPNATDPTGAGCDGLFSTAWDLGKYAQMLLNDGKYVTGIVNSSGSCSSSSCQINTLLSSSRVQELTTIQTVDANDTPFGNATPTDWTEDLLFANKAFGFELSQQRDYSVGGHSLPGVYKTGGAGTFLIIDPVDDLFIVVLTNHGLPRFDANFTADFNAMLEEIGPHRVADSVEHYLLP